MQPKIPFKLTLPIHSHQRKPEHPRQISSFFSKDREADKAHTKSEKDLMNKSPPTPNLQFIKINKMRKQQEELDKNNDRNHNNNNNRHRSPIAIFQKSTENIDDVENNSRQSKTVCPGHPNKKAKCSLIGNPNGGFCAKCAPNFDDIEPVMDESKLHKLKGVDGFRNMIKMVKGLLTEREEEVTNHSKVEDFHYENAIRCIDHEFETLILLVQQKHDQLIESLTRRYHQSAERLSSQRSTISTISSSLDKYLFDVDRNYEEIINDLSLSQFDDIMNQYQAKISDFIRKVDKSLEAVPDTKSIKKEAINIAGRIKLMSIDGRGHTQKSSIFERNENCDILNKLKVKTPDRTLK